VSLLKIHDIRYEISGAMRTFLNYGNLYIRTPGIEEIFKLEDIEDPYGAQQKIIELIDKLHEKQKSPISEQEKKIKKRKIILR
jgi:hypothetical protein